MERIIIKLPEEDRVIDRSTPNEMVVHVKSYADVSDGYHSIQELYDHRITLYIALCRAMKFINDVTKTVPVWRSKVHSDHTVMNGWFILGIGKTLGDQITYHLPLARWEETDFAETLDRAPEWDEHTSAEVLQRLKDL